jgi:hypothetical protein
MAQLPPDWDYRFPPDSKQYSSAFFEISKQRDRNAAIIAASVLEDHVLEAMILR